MKILVIPDKFKGTLTASAAAEAISRGWLKARPRHSIEPLPMTDGGDGFGKTIARLLRAKTQTLATVDAAHRSCNAKWWWEPKSKMAVIESAEVIGLAKLGAGKFLPFALDTFGLGALIRAAAAKGAKRCIIGIGGSATNDGGFGLARALGWKFYDKAGRPIDQWTELHKLARIFPRAHGRWFKELIVAVDVQNPLLGTRGATRVYGPQKGLRPSELADAERDLRKLAEVLGREQFGVPASGVPNGLKSELRTVPGAGAAGGLGFGLMAFLRARPESGFHLFARLADLDERLRAADLVITGEGCVDASTFMGKGVGEIARRCRQWKIPCVALGGSIAAGPSVKRIFTEVRALTELTTVEEAKRNPGRYLECLAARIARTYGASKA